MSVESISGLSSSTTSATNSTSQNDQLGRDAFLQLLVAQMTHQDPTQPTDSTENLSQLAQFSTVSGIEDMRDSVASLSDSLRSSQVLSGTSLVGHAVLAVGDTAALDEDGSIYGTTTVPSGASDAAVIITDSSGQQVARIQLSATAGDQAFSWDGTTSLGEIAPAGTYTVKTVATVGSSTQQLETQIASYVQSVSIDPTTYTLTLNTSNGSIALADVRQVV